MRKIIKSDKSEVVREGLTYKVNGDNKKLAESLCQEQNSICAYTETYLGRTDKKDIEHFNPTLKGTSADGYGNWFLVKAQWNSEKASKWANYQPILLPTDADFEKRIVYFEGDYIAASQADVEAVNLIKLLKLDDYELATERYAYLENLKETLAYSGKTAQQFVDDLLSIRPSLVYFIRAVQEELNVKVDFDLIKHK
jgi:hypothetical protein